MSGVEAAVVDRIIDKHGEAGTLIAILTDIQKKCSYLPREALQRVSQRLEIPFSQVFSVSTFYKIFSLAPRGKHSLKVCLGTACHVKGAGLILDRLARDLGIREGGTTKDGNFTLETVRCVGCCSIAPVVMVDESAHGRLKQEELPGILARYAKPMRTRARAASAQAKLAGKAVKRPKAGGRR